MLSIAFNTAQHESTMATPDILFLGREMCSPLMVKWDLTPLQAKLDSKQESEYWAKAYRSLCEANTKVAGRFNKNRRPHGFKVGDRVRYRLNVLSSKAQGVSAKMALRWSEPTVISREVRPNVVLLAHPVTGVVVRRAQVSQLKSCGE
jgi:hypothetical protein